MGSYARSEGARTLHIFLFEPLRVRDYPAVFILEGEGNPLRMLRNEIGITVGPLDERNAIAENIIVESEPENSLAIFDPVKIEMVNGQAAIGVFVHEHERRTGHFAAASHPGRETFAELRFSPA